MWHATKGESRITPKHLDHKVDAFLFKWMNHIDDGNSRRHLLHSVVSILLNVWETCQSVSCCSLSSVWSSYRMPHQSYHDSTPVFLQPVSLLNLAMHFRHACLLFCLSGKFLPSLGSLDWLIPFTAILLAKNLPWDFPSLPFIQSTFHSCFHILMVAYILSVMSSFK